MVTILPSRVSIADQLGLSMGQGLQQGLQQAAQTQYQRGLIQDALGRAKGVLSSQAPFAEKALALMEAGAGIPGSEKYFGTLLDLLAKQTAPTTRPSSYGGVPSPQPGQPPQPRQSQQPGQLAQPIQLEQPIQPEQLGQFVQPIQAPQAAQPQVKPTYEEAIKAQEKELTTPVSQEAFISYIPQPQIGLLSPLKSVDQMSDQARTMAIQNPQLYTYETAFDALQNENNAKAAQQQAFENKIVNSGIKPENIPIFSKIAEKVSNQFPRLDSNGLFIETNRKFQEYNRLADAVKGQFIPGFFTGPQETGVTKPGILQPGKKQNLPIQDYINGKITREGALKQFRPNINKLVNLGFEAEARNILADQGLTPFETEYVIHPPTKMLESKIKNFKGSTVEDLSKFLYENITNQDSLLVSRDLLKDKYNHIQFKQALDSIPKPFYDNLQTWQQIEYSPLAEAPRDSLAQIFHSYGRFIDYFKGAR